MKLTLKNIYNTISKYFIQVIIISFLLFLQTCIIVKTELFATKQDIGDITEIVEEIENKYAKNLEEIKSALNEESNIRNTRRELYTDMAKSMRVFITSSVPSTKNETDMFVKNYSSVWLWANDKTILELNKFLNLQILRHTEKTITHETYAKVMLAMRKEIIPDTKLKTDDYIFLQFVQK